LIATPVPHNYQQEGLQSQYMYLPPTPPWNFCGDPAITSAIVQESHSEISIVIKDQFVKVQKYFKTRHKPLNRARKVIIINTTASHSRTKLSYRDQGGRGGSASSGKGVSRSGSSLAPGTFDRLGSHATQQQDALGKQIVP
jgi:hypothetical protein